MNKFSAKIKFLMFLQFALRFVAPFIVPIALIFAKKTSVITTHYAQPPIQRYKLPSWLFFMETPDELLPGGLYEPKIKKIYEKYGWFMASWSWLGTRNVGHGLMWDHGKEIPKHIAIMSDLEREHYGIFSVTKIYGPIKIIYGYKGVNDWYSLKTNKGIWAVPRFTMRLTKQD